MLRVQGFSMTGAAIFPGDVLIVDASMEPQVNDVVIVRIDGEFTVKRIKKMEGHLYFSPENPEAVSIRITPNLDYKIFGVVTYSIHPHKKDRKK